MSYSPTTDFLGLLRQTSGGVRTERMPGLDYVVAALARMGLFTLSVGQTPPTTNQASTVWFNPSTPSWVAEGTVFLWNVATAEYEPATPALWSALLANASLGYVFQSAAAPTNRVNNPTSLVAVQRAAPSFTSLALPSVVNRLGKPLQITDQSSSVTSHQITVTPFGSETVMQQATWELLSTADQLAGVTLYPSTDLNGWVIA